MQQFKDELYFKMSSEITQNNTGSLKIFNF